MEAIGHRVDFRPAITTEDRNSASGGTERRNLLPRIGPCLFAAPEVGEHPAVSREDAIATACSNSGPLGAADPPNGSLMFQFQAEADHLRRGRERSRDHSICQQ